MTNLQQIVYSDGMDLLEVSSTDDTFSFQPQTSADSVATWTGSTNPAGTFTYSVDPLSVAKRVEAPDGSSTMTAVTTQSPWGLPYDSSYECQFGTTRQCPLTLVPETS
eukprot:CAMPEP_0172194230 /NCGR_PEP_ID=MMETSP1050-20130122/25448_1 /TAXON_ID=233186 /ORGANISM="Cryptomonas curvata, Strain CCAP979/52" /LENGTH=107 /DNA_ID=CAMNT_0012869981 /DNA_START=46 /DNA_END=370 /DNA_ORIENTATION=-